MLPVGRVFAKVDEMPVMMDTLSYEARHLLSAAVVWIAVLFRVYPRLLRMDGEEVGGLTSDSLRLLHSHLLTSTPSGNQFL